MDPAGAAPQAFNPLMPRPQPPGPPGANAAPPPMHAMNMSSDIPGQSAQMPAPSAPSNPPAGSEPMATDSAMGGLQPTAPIHNEPNPPSVNPETPLESQEAMPAQAEHQPEVNPLNVQMPMSNMNGMPGQINPAPGPSMVHAAPGPNQIRGMNNFQQKTGLKRPFEEGMQQLSAPEGPMPGSHQPNKAPRLGGAAAPLSAPPPACLLYTSDAADEEDSVDLGGPRLIQKKKTYCVERLFDNSE
eukprot:TRINITY_DN18639_c0_g1_i1.p1 TRINITY_DN18639_c0_g1~~TRINITY_DN18639_c0_g1_i1.p1  ORF type:complete len:243 (-),score=23.03 TRINITY_DN18639_c0_g1_i1:74-802(-)